MLAEVQPVPPDQAPPVASMASVIGVRRADDKAELPACVEVRLRVEDSGTHIVKFDPRSLDLINGSLWKFPPAIVRPPEIVTIRPGEAALIGAYFPFPPGKDWDDIDMESLQLRWTVLIDGKVAEQAAYFRRIWRRYYYYDPYWGYPGPWVGGGVVIVRGRWR